MTTGTSKPHLSATQLDMHCRCPEAYRRRYIEGERIPPGIALLKGKAVHSGAETNMRQKLESHVDLPAHEIVEASVAAFEAETAGGYALSDEEAAKNASVVIGEAKDEVAGFAAVHAATQAPEYQPILVEQAVLLPLPGPYDLLGVIDLADDQRRVVDFKTAKRSKRQSDVDESVQLTVYAAAWWQLYREPPVEVRLDTLVRTKASTKRQVLSSQRDEHDMKALAARINAVSAAIQAGVFPPAAPGSWWCSSRWCGYWSDCPYVNNERRSAAEGEE